MTYRAYDFLSKFINEGRYMHIARQLHQSWLENKQAQGWKYGPERDKDEKTNPLMVPFDELSPIQQSANYASPYAVVNFFRTQLTEQMRLDEFEILLEQLLRMETDTEQFMLLKLGEYIHSHFIINLLAQGESVETRDDMIIFEDLDNESKSWDTELALDVIDYLLETIRDVELA